MSHRAPLAGKFLEEVGGIFRVLGDPTRLEILQALMTGPKAVGEVVVQTGKGQANVSKHLSLLASASLVRRTKRGTQAIYEIAEPLVFDLCDLVCNSVRARLAKQVKANSKLLRTTV